MLTNNCRRVDNLEYLDSGVGFPFPCQNLVGFCVIMAIEMQ
jgi:hypothetical protein